MDSKKIIQRLREKSQETDREGMRRFGIEVSHALGVKIPVLRKMAREFKPDHLLAQELWETEIHEARILASMIDDPARVTLSQIQRWVNDFNSWDLCDQVCGNLFDRTAYAVTCAEKFSGRKELFVKRAGFVLMAEYAVHIKDAPDPVFLDFLTLIVREAWDDRNFVKKAVNWALRQIGKRNGFLHAKALDAARLILEQDHPSAQWIARDAIRELENRGTGWQRG